MVTLAGFTSQDWAGVAPKAGLCWGSGSWEDVAGRVPHDVPGVPLALFMSL